MFWIPMGSTCLAGLRLTGRFFKYYWQTGGWAFRGWMLQTGQLAPYLNRMEYVPRESASIRQPHWHRHLDGKRPTLSRDLRRVVCSESAVCRLFAEVDFRREMRPIAFVGSGAFSGLSQKGSFSVCRTPCLYPPPETVQSKRIRTETGD